MTTLITPRVKLDQAAKKYILESIDNAEYDATTILQTPKEKLTFLYETFIKEYGWSIKRYGEVNAFREWLQGLPSSMNIAFTNYDILELAKKWQYYSEPMTKRQEDKVIDNWFNLIAVKTFQLFRKYKVGQ